MVIKILIASASVTLVPAKIKDLKIYNCNVHERDARASKRKIQLKTSEKRKFFNETESA